MAAKAQEIWEATTPGTTYVSVRDPRNPEGWTRRKVGGKGSKRITITVEEREFNQELVQYENQHQDPFTNGALIRVSPKEVERGVNERSDAQLIAMLRMTDDDAFEAELRSIKSEVVIRRLMELARAHTSMMRFEAVQTVVDERYSIGKASLVVREMEGDDARYSRADL